MNFRYARQRVARLIASVQPNPSTPQIAWPESSHLKRQAEERGSEEAVLPKAPVHPPLYDNKPEQTPMI